MVDNKIVREWTHNGTQGNVHLYLLIVFTFSYLWTDVKDCMKSTQVFSDLLVVINLCPSEYWVQKKFDKPQSQVHSPESKVQNPNFWPKAGTISLGLEWELGVWQKRRALIGLKECYKKVWNFPQFRLSESTQRVLR